MGSVRYAPMDCEKALRRPAISGTKLLLRMLGEGGGGSPRFTARFAQPRRPGNNAVSLDGVGDVCAKNFTTIFYGLWLSSCIGSNETLVSSNLRSRRQLGPVLHCTWPLDWPPAAASWEGLTSRRAMNRQKIKIDKEETFSSLIPFLACM